MKKLLLVTDAWHPQVNGVVTVFDRLIPILRERGLETVVVHPELFRTFAFPFYPEVPMAILPGFRMEELFDEEKPDYIHIATEWTLGISARSLCLERGLPFTTSYHTNFAQYVGHYLSPKLQVGTRAYERAAFGFMRWFHNAGKATLTSNPAIAEELCARGFQNVVPWPFGVDAERFTRNPDAPELFEHPVFVYFGRLAREKHIQEFLRLELPGTKLVIGDGPYRDTLEKEYGATARFVGYKRGQELVDILSVSDVSVFPSSTETFGLTILEALSMGLPVAAYDVTGPRELIDSGVNGVLGDNLKDAALACLTLSRDACRAKALQYPWKKSADVFQEHIEAHPIRGEHS